MTYLTSEEIIVTTIAKVIGDEILAKIIGIASVNYGATRKIVKAFVHDNKLHTISEDSSDPRTYQIYIGIGDTLFLWAKYKGSLLVDYKSNPQYKGMMGGLVYKAAVSSNNFGRLSLYENKIWDYLK